MDDPATDHPPSGSRAAATRAQLRRLLQMIGRPGAMVAFVALSLVGSAAEAVAILLVAAGAAGLAGGDPTASVSLGPWAAQVSYLALVLTGLGLAATMVSGRLLGQRIAARLSGGLLHRMRELLLRGLLDAPWERQAMMTSARFQDLVSVQALRTANVVALLANGSAALIAFLAMAAMSVLISPVTAAVLLAVGAVLMLAFRPVTRRVHRLSFEHLSEHHDYVDHVSNLFGVLAEIRIHGVDRAVAREHEQVNAGVADRYRQMRFWASVQPVLYLGVVIGLLLLGLTAVRVGSSVDVGLVGAIGLVLLRGLRYSQSAQSAWQRVVELLPYVTDMDRAFDEWAGQRRPWGSRHLDRAGRLEVEDVHYTYPSGDVGLAGVSLTVEPGRIVGLAGPSGAGKSTLAQLLLGLRVPDRGTYRVDGVPTTEFDERSWFDRFAYVTQQPVLLRGDIAHNVRFLRDDVTDDDVAWALEAAALTPDLATWPEGAGRQVGESGTEVSGGQRQRIAIARALARHPDVLVLDEPTSALDPEAEQTLRATLARLRGEVTIILIAHRESTLEVCDVVVALADGRVTGTREQPSVGRSKDH